MDWRRGKDPLLSSLFGHIFLQSAEGYWYLDVIGGSLELLWPDAATLQTALDTQDGQDDFLLGGLAFGADRRGLVLADNEVFDFNPALVLGGPLDLANLTTMDFEVAVNIAGQIHEQVRNLPGRSDDRTRDGGRRAEAEELEVLATKPLTCRSDWLIGVPDN